MSFRLYRRPAKDEFLVCGADPAEGGDYCCGVWKSKARADTVLSFHAKTESSQFGYELYKGSKFLYDTTGIWPTIAVERNTGQATIAKLLDLNYPSMYAMESFDTAEAMVSKRIGWSTNTATRQKMLDDLALSIRQGVNRIYDAEAIREFYSFIRHPKTGRPEAESGTNDDWVFAEAIAWQMYLLVDPPFKDSDYSGDYSETETLFTKEGWRL